MSRAFAAWARAVAGSVPSRVGTAALMGAWLALTVLFAFVGSVVVLTATVAMGPPTVPASVALVVFAIVGTPAVSLMLAQKVVASTVERVEPLVVRDGVPAPDGGRVSSDGTSSPETDPRAANERPRRQSPKCC